jgi:hypothetical protein
LRTTLVCFGMYNPRGLEVNKLGEQTWFLVLPDTLSSLNILANLCRIYTASFYLTGVMSSSRMQKYQNLKDRKEIEVQLFKAVCGYGYVMINVCMHEVMDKRCQ